MSASLDLEAPIIPGKSAAGIQVGQSIDDLLALEWRQHIVKDVFGDVHMDFRFRQWYNCPGEAR